MSSQGRNRPYEMGRPKEDMSSYRDSPYSSKSRNDMDGRKRDSYSSRGGGSMGDKLREHYPSKANRRSMEDHKDSYISGDKRDSYKRGRERERDEYSRGGRERDYSMDSRDEEFHSRGIRDSFHSRGRGSRGSYGSSRGGRDSFSSRGRESFSSRGRESFSSRGRESFSSRGGRESFSRGGRESFSRGGRESFSRGGRESFSTRGSYGSGRGRSFSRGSYGSRGGRESFSMRGSRGSNRGFWGSSHRGSKSDNFISHLGPRAHMELTKKLVASVLEDSDSEDRGHFDDERPYRSKEFRREGRGFFHRDSDRLYKEPRGFAHHSASYIPEDKMIKRERSASASHFDKEKFRSKLRMRDKFRGPPPKRIHDDDDFDLDEEPPVKHARLSRRGRDRESPFEDFDKRPSRSYSPPQRSISREERPVRKISKEEERGKRKAEREGAKAKAVEERGKVVEKRSKRKISEEEEEEDEPEAELDKLDETEENDNKQEEEEEEDGGQDQDEDHDENIKSSSSRAKVNRKLSREEDVDDDNDEDDENFVSRRRHSHRDGDSSPSGMQVTILSDGERAVNREGRVKARIAGGKVFVDLQCPHCPSQTGKSIVTFKEYRYHLDSRSHRARILKLAFKHSIVLRGIRLQQRNEQRAMEEKWEQENSDEFSTTVSRYCKLCKLAFKCLPEDNSKKGIAEHKESKLHNVQKRYLYPRCTMCRMSFPSRLVYEFHLASIRHLRMRAYCQEGFSEVSSKDEGPRSDREEVDLTNFITMDSVGEDEEIGSEHDEIMGKLEDIEKAEEDAKEGEDEDEEEEEDDGPEEEESKRQRRKLSASPSVGVDEREDPFEVDLEEEPLDHEVEDMPADEDNEICGKEYVVPMEAFYCKLCRKAIRIDTDIGDEAIDRHCRSARHLEEFNYLGSEEFLEEHGENFDEPHLHEEQEEEEEEDDDEEHHTFDGEEDHVLGELEEVNDENGEGDEEWKEKVGSREASGDEEENPDECADEAEEEEEESAQREKKVNGK